MAWPWQDMIAGVWAMENSEQSRTTRRRATDNAEVSGLLRAWSEGDRAALDRLTPIVYDELRRLASRYMRGDAPVTACKQRPWSIEAYMRLVDYKTCSGRNRAHFFRGFGPVDEAHPGGDMHGAIT